MATINAPATSLQFKNSHLFGIQLRVPHSVSTHTRRFVARPVAVEAKAKRRLNTRTENAKVRNRRMLKKFNGTATKPRLSVFSSGDQLYVLLVDDQNKKCLFSGSTLQKSVRGDPPCSTVEAAERVGEELIKVCISLNINEISNYDRNGFARGERMKAFEIPVANHGFLPR